MTALPYEAPSVTGCGFVVRREVDGPCDWHGLFGEECERQPEEHCIAHADAASCADAHHEHIGKVVARCGHPESDHVTAKGTARSACRGCVTDLSVQGDLNYGAVFHAFTVSALTEAEPA